MKSATKKSRLLIHTVLILSAAFVLCFIGYNSMVRNGTNQSLTENQIAELRDEYPICGDSELIKSIVDMRIPTMSELKEHVDTFVYGKVEGEMSSYSQYISSGNPELDAKRNTNGRDDIFEFYEHTVSIIEDTSGIYKAGDQISIVSNKIFIDYNPHFSDGMKVVIPSALDKEVAGRVHYDVYGMYYVTEDGYAISAFEEKRMMKKALSGIKVEKLLEELKK
ncbi:MAG: hypothetical protein K2N87_20035 [Eubacterium sp.]|nr:hypothetical protein [Eubacterium sp.]